MLFYGSHNFCALLCYIVYYEQILSPVSAVLYTQPEIAAVVSQRLTTGARPVRTTTAIATAKSQGVKRTLEASTVDENGITNKGSAFEASKTCVKQTKAAKKAKTTGCSFTENKTATVTSAVTAVAASSSGNYGIKRQLRPRNQMSTVGSSNNNNINSVADNKEKHK
jgi:hypothetical protein